MKKIVITIEDTKYDGLSQVSWTAEPGGELDPNGTSAEQTAWLVLQMLLSAKEDAPTPDAEAN